MKLNFMQLSSLLFGREEQHEKFQSFLFSLQFGLAGTNEIIGFLAKGTILSPLSHSE